MSQAVASKPAAGASPSSVEPAPAPVCRICHSAGSPAHELVTPCHCRGTCSSAHAACLEEWIARRMRSGQTLARASTCEICLQPYAHTLHAPHPAAFLLGAGAWTRWAHVAYMGFVGRRMAFEVRVVVRLLRGVVGASGGVVGRKPGKTRDLVGRVAFSMLMAVHYGLFLALDVRHLFTQYRKWRAATCRVVVKDRVAQAEEVVVEVEEGEAA